MTFRLPVVYVAVTSAYVIHLSLQLIALGVVLSQFALFYASLVIKTEA